jgi:hypothetical protein
VNQRHRETKATIKGVLAGKLARCPFDACGYEPGTRELLAWCRGYAYGRIKLASKCVNGLFFKELRSRINDQTFQGMVDHAQENFEALTRCSVPLLHWDELLPTLFEMHGPPVGFEDMESWPKS